jgi:hypothetical protein
VTIKLRNIIKHPASVVGGTGIAIEKENGTYTYSLDLASLSEADTIPDDAAALIPILTPGATDDDPDVTELISVETFLNETAAVNQDRQIISGAGLTGGGDLSTNRTLAVGAGSGITVNADDVALTPISTLNLMANLTGGSAAASGSTLTAILDAILGNTQGAILTRQSSAWVKLDPGTSGHFLKSQGAGANLTYAAVPGGGDLLSTNNLSDVANAYTSLQNLHVLLSGQGVLVKNGASLEFQRMNGRNVFINGQIEQIPSTAPTLSAPATSGTLYYIYVYMSAGTMTLEASTTAYATDSTYGHKIKSGDATRTLVGMARTVSSAWVDSATQRFVRSWFNRDKPALSVDSIGATNHANVSPTEIDSSKRLEFLIWSGETVMAFGSTVGAFTTTAPGTQDLDVGFNGTTAENGMRIRMSESSVSYGATVATAKTGLSEGYNYVTLTNTYVAGGANAQLSAGSKLRAQLH